MCKIDRLTCVEGALRLSYCKMLYESPKLLDCKSSGHSLRNAYLLPITLRIPVPEPQTQIGCGTYFRYHTMNCGAQSTLGGRQTLQNPRSVCHHFAGPRKSIRCARQAIQVTANGQKSTNSLQRGVERFFQVSSYRLQDAECQREPCNRIS